MLEGRELLVFLLSPETPREQVLPYYDAVYSTEKGHQIHCALDEELLALGAREAVEYQTSMEEGPDGTVREMGTFWVDRVIARRPDISLRDVGFGCIANSHHPADSWWCSWRRESEHPYTHDGKRYIRRVSHAEWTLTQDWLKENPSALFALTLFDPYEQLLAISITANVIDRAYGSKYVGVLPLMVKASEGTPALRSAIRAIQISSDKRRIVGRLEQTVKEAWVSGDSYLALLGMMRNFVQSVAKKWKEAPTALPIDRLFGE